MVGPRAVGISVYAILFAGCAATPPEVPGPEPGRQVSVGPRIGTDLAAAKARAGTGLLLVEFAGGAGTAERSRDAQGDGRHRDAAGCEVVRLDPVEHATLFRRIFRTEPEPGFCVMDAKGCVVAARLGRLSDVAAVLRQAELGHGLVRELQSRLEKMPMRGQRDHRVETAFLLAEAYLVSGNRFAAYEHYTLVTLLAGDRAVSRRALLRSCERLARLEIEGGRPHEAREWLAHLRDEDPSGTVHRREVRLTEALVARAESEVSKAHAILSDLRGDTENEEADRVWLEYGRICLQSGRDAEARRAFRTVLSRYPDSPARAEATVELRQLDGLQSPRK